MASNAQINANRAADEPALLSEAKTQERSQLSTGPTSEAGKSKSSKNAVTTGLTGRTVLLPTEDAALYESHLASFRDHYKPAGEAELNLVQSLADTEWRLQRIPSLEAGIYAIGRLELAGLFPDEEESVRKQLIEAKIFLTYQRQLNNLSIQENRLRRQREKDLAALKELQDARLDRAAREYFKALGENRHKEFDPTPFGFVFSEEQIGHIRRRAMALYPHTYVKYLDRPSKAA